MKLRRNLEFSLCQAYWAAGFSLRWERANFGNGYVSLAQKNDLPFGKALEVARKMRFRFMYIEPNHDSFID